jgi:hypothetical protein
MNEPKRHHIVPVSYLERFCRDGALWVFNREDGSCINQTPINTAVRKHFYTYTDKDGNRRTGIEKVLSKFEGMAKPAFDRLAAGESLDIAGREAVAAFISFAMNRTVGFQRDYNAMRAHMSKVVADIAFASVEATEATLARHERETGFRPALSAEELHAAHWSGDYEFEVHRNESLRAMLEHAEEMANVFCGMVWRVFHASERASFITSDNPFFMMPTKPVDPRWPGIGILTPGVVNVFPLSQSACLTMTDSGGGLTHIRMPAADVRRLNMRTALYCDRYLFARDAALVKSIAEHTKLRERGRIQRFGIY